MKRRIITATLALLAAYTVLPAQNSNITVRGGIISEEDGSPVDFASILLSPSNMYSMTDKDGRFSIENVPSGEITLSVEFFGMEKVDTTFTAMAGETVNLNLKMRPVSFRLEHVVVTATQNKAGSSTASNISRQAMDHMQTSSINDVMALLPGVEISNPDLSSAQSLTIRSINGASVPNNALGTAIYMDGAPLSNNANLQTLSPVIGGSTSTPAGGADPSSGVDVRGLSADNIESIEVIRGIPSVEYGDLTSGAVIVKSKAGESPLTVRFKANPNIYQVSAAKGFSLGRRAGDLNISADYAYNQNSLTQSFAFYQRANAKALWSVMVGNHTSSNTSFTFTYGRDTRNRNPDDTYPVESRANEIGIRLNNNGSAYINREWLKSINWTVSASYTGKKSYYLSTATNATSLYSTAMENAVYTNIPGLEISDTDGNPITFLPSGSEDIKGTILPYSYEYFYNIYGKEVNAYAKLNFDMSHTWGNVTDRLLAGADFKTDGNLGEGAVYNDDTPPYRSIDNTASGYRKRPYYDIPFVNQLGVYVEDQFNYRFAQRELNISAGLRFDYVNGLTALAPRINASIDACPWMTIRGGWGITNKAPTSLYLYPNYAYHDLVLYNGMDVNRPEEERLLVAQTTVYDVSNPDLEIASNRKAEIGIDFNIKKRFRVSVTAYDEYMKNGYSFGTDIGSFHWMTYTNYKVADENPGSIPTLTKGDTYSSFFMTYSPMNSQTVRNSGVEYEIDLGRFDAIRTSFYINGAWMKGYYQTNGNSFGTRKPAGGSPEYNVAIYDACPQHHSERFNTTLRITHNIPKIGLAITLTGQFTWFYKYWTEYPYNDEMPSMYISHEDGKVYAFDPSFKDDPEFSYMIPSLSPGRFTMEQYQPYAIFNLNVSKEIGDALTASFYVNNMFNSHPLYKRRTTGSYIDITENIPIFFGFELKVSIR